MHTWHNGLSNKAKPSRHPIVTRPCTGPPPPAGETEEQYQRTEDLVRAIGFDRVNTAAYSPRPNTPAAEWEDQVGRQAVPCPRFIRTGLNAEAVRLIWTNLLQ
jgi:hypothetical protein